MSIIRVLISPFAGMALAFEVDAAVPFDYPPGTECLAVGMHWFYLADRAARLGLRYYDTRSEKGKCLARVCRLPTKVIQDVYD